MSEDELKRAIDQRDESDEVLFYYEDPVLRDADGIDNYQFVVAGEEAATDFVTMLRSLPQVLRDTGELTQVVTGLITVILKQQIQINELSERLDATLRANIALKAQENVHDILTKLTAQGSDVNGPEVTIRITAAESSSTSKSGKSARASKSQSSRSQSAKIAADANALIKSLASMTFGADVKKSQAATQIKQLKSQISSMEQHVYQGDVIIKFESITGDPMIQARAEAIRRGPKGASDKDSASESTGPVPKSK
ncbi:MAG: hypothetical protein ISS70_21415 [Phycisphaerae bacterium]|nr:hypothetical protein [Phycisphaerae bacterium]